MTVSIAAARLPINPRKHRFEAGNVQVDVLPILDSAISKNYTGWRALWMPSTGFIVVIERESNDGKIKIGYAKEEDALEERIKTFKGSILEEAVSNILVRAFVSRFGAAMCITDYL